MNEPTLTCPNCHCDIRLTESLAAPLIESARRQDAQKLAQQHAEFARREVALRDQQAAVARAREEVEEQVAKTLAAQREKICAEEALKARQALATDLKERDRALAELNQVLQIRDEKLAEAQKAQAELIRKQRELDDSKREMELTIETRVSESLTLVREKAKRDAEDALKLKVGEKEQTIAAMARQIEDLKRRAEQGSEQLQGEALEVELESLLRTRFPRDTVEPVAKGEHGGDVLHRVLTPIGAIAGTILWESKRTKNWTEGWLAKLRDDQRSAKAEIAVIVSLALPKGIENFDLCDGVWVVEPRCAMPIAVVLRQSLLELSVARQAADGQQTKVELVYHYLTGPRFRQRVQAIVEKFTDMREDLDRERKFLTRQWAKREVQIQNVVESTAGMYGDLQGIAGRSLAEIDGLDAKLLGEE